MHHPHMGSHLYLRTCLPILCHHQRACRLWYRISFINDVFLRLNFRFFRGFHFVVKLCPVRPVTFATIALLYHHHVKQWLLQSQPWYRMWQLRLCRQLHVLYSCRSYQIIFTKLKFLEVDLTSCVVLHAFDFNAIFFKNELEFTCLKSTAIKGFREFQLKWNWNAVYTFFSWFFWFLNLVRSWL